MPLRWVLLATRWALSSSVDICDTANRRMAFTRMATSSIWAAMRWPWRVPSSRVSSTRMLMYLRDRAREGSAPACPPTRLHAGLRAAPLEVGDVLVVGLAADVNDLGKQLVAVGRALGLVHVGHQLLDDLHQVLLGHLEGGRLVREGQGGPAGRPGGRVGTYHAVQEVEGPQPDGLVLVVQAL